MHVDQHLLAALRCASDQSGGSLHLQRGFEFSCTSLDPASWGG
jgi:hypothetical protein